MDCLICANNLAAIRLGCGHKWCWDCLLLLFRKAVHHESHYPPKCCEALSVDKFQNVLGPELVETFKIKELEYAIPANCRLYCSCGTFLMGLNPLGSAHSAATVFCSECYRFTCTKCKATRDFVDQPHTCIESSPPEVVEYTPEHRVKRCPSCTTLIQHAEACNHMICIVCKHVFCWVCLEDWSLVQGRHPHCPAYGDPEYNSQGYDQFGYHRDTGYDADGYNIRGLNMYGRNKRGSREPIYRFAQQTNRLDAHYQGLEEQFSQDRFRQDCRIVRDELERAINWGLTMTRQAAPNSDRIENHITGVNKQRSREIQAHKARLYADLTTNRTYLEGQRPRHLRDLTTVNNLRVEEQIHTGFSAIVKQHRSNWAAIDWTRADNQRIHWMEERQRLERGEATRDEKLHSDPQLYCFTVACQFLETRLAISASSLRTNDPRMTAAELQAELTAIERLWLECVTLHERIGPNLEERVRRQDAIRSEEGALRLCLMAVLPPILRMSRDQCSRGKVSG